MTDLLIEIGCEDLPARYLQDLGLSLWAGLYRSLRNGAQIEQAFAQSVRGQIEQAKADPNGKAKFEIDNTAVFVTPRRIAVLIKNVPERLPDQEIVRVGPKLAVAIKEGQPTPAGLGFARSCNVPFDELAQEDGTLVFRATKIGPLTVDAIPAIFDDCIRRMDEKVPKRMRWGSGNATFVRPVQWLVAMYGQQVIPFERFGIATDRITYGHRFHAPAAITLTSPADYEDRLLAAHVWADSASREVEIHRQVHDLATQVGGYPRIEPELLNEVTALVEWPVAIAGGIEAQFLELPPEVIVATVETNQRYFTLFEDATHRRLLPRFITVANIESRDVAQVIAGNERVVRPRLSDALFFWRQDLRQPLEAWLPQLDAVTFQKELGSVGSRVDRLVALSGTLAQTLGLDPAPVQRAAKLAKADLASKMVYEFPELQGIMGGYYAQRAGEAAEVALAITEHYLPAQQGTAIPSGAAGQLVALADKLDLLAGCFAIGQKPTASRDPFGLRRAALGCLRICVEAGLALNLREALSAALALQPAGKRDDTTLDEAWTFMVERLRGYSLDRGATAEQFEAVRASGAAVPMDLERRLDALRRFAADSAAASLAAADKRARNLLRQAGIDGPAPHVGIQLFQSDAEHSLLAALDRVEAALAPLRAGSDYAGMLAQLATLKAPVDAFFDAVMVMVDDPAVRANRLALLARLDAACREVADLSCLPG